MKEEYYECPHCSGSGEGQHENEVCVSCGGTGESDSSNDIDWYDDLIDDDSDY